MIHVRESLGVPSPALARLHRAGKTLGAILRTSVKTRPGLWFGFAALSVFGIAWAAVKLVFVSGGGMILALLRDASHQVGGAGLPGAGGASGGAWNPMDPNTWKWQGPDPMDPRTWPPDRGAPGVNPYDPDTWGRNWVQWGRQLGDLGAYQLTEPLNSSTEPIKWAGYEARDELSEALRRRQDPSRTE